MSRPKLSLYGARRRRHHRPEALPPASREIVIDFNQLPSYQIIIKSFRRFRCLKLLVDSILRFYPDASIIVADDSFEDPDSELPQIARGIQSLPNVEWLQLPFNVGLAVGRNAAIRHSTAEAILMCDDDFVFTQETRIENLLVVLREHADTGLVAGCVRFDGINASNWPCILDWSEGQPMRALPLNTSWDFTCGVRHRATDLALNWYAARREMLLRCPWDNQFKIVMEHIDHFMEMKRAGVRVRYTPDSVIGHEPRSPEFYGTYRMQNVEEYKQLFLDKWKITSRLGFAMQPEPGLPPVTHDAGRSVLVFGVGHSGTTIATEMVESLGFNAHNADVEYRENEYIRDLNQKCLKTGVLDIREARRELAFMEQAGPPWVLKDPRFVHTMDHWQSVFAAYKPFMLYITRDIEAIAESFERRREDQRNARGELITRGLTLPEACALADTQFDRWPWGKIKIDLSQLSSAASLFDCSRP